MDRNIIREEMPRLVAGHMPRNLRHFTFRILDGKPADSMFGPLDPQPVEGKVIATTDQAIVLKVAGKRSEFVVLDRALATLVPEAGASVRATPYARRNFDGRRVDEALEEERVTPDGIPFKLRHYIMGGVKVKLPVPKVECFELSQLIEQLEEMSAPDGYRCIAHLLVDAGAKDFTVVDPKPSQIIATPPEVAFTVENACFKGRIRVIYDRGLDTYVIEAIPSEGEMTRIESVFMDELGDVLARLIDDGSWRRIQVEVLPEKPKKPH